MENYRREIQKVNQEKRQSDRIDFQCPIVISGGNRIETITDINLTGVFIEMENPSIYKPGQLIDITLKFPMESKTTKLKTKIVFLNERGVGCQFIDLTSEDTQMIQFYTNNFQNTLPLL